MRHHPTAGRHETWSRQPPHCPRCRQLSLHWTAWNYLTVTLHTGSQSHRLHTVHSTGVPGPSLTICGFRIFSLLPVPTKKSFSEVLSIFLPVDVYYWHFCQLTEVPLRVQLYVDMYPDDTRTVFMSHVSMFTGVGMLVLRAEV